MQSEHLSLEKKDILSWMDLDVYDEGFDDEEELCKQLQNLWNFNYQTIRKLDFCQFDLQSRQHLFPIDSHNFT